jgi:2-polyprenyl-3-methyl-5-hydroxy-6-metoxy-1,4-benzoquinol methylase
VSQQPGCDAIRRPPTDRLAGSFRDPAGKVIFYQNRVLRIVSPSGMLDLRAFLESSTGDRLVKDALVIPTRELDDDEVQSLLADSSLAELTGNGPISILEHERIPFPSYPYEWPAEMLFSAGQLTLDIALRLLPENFGLKDGTPYNVLFRGPRPVFVDVLSFERRQPSDAIWLPYAQFVRTFLLPLLAAKHFGLAPAQTLLTHRDGLEPEQVYLWLSLTQKVSPTFLSLVSLPCWLASRYKDQSTTVHAAKRTMQPEKARFILEHLLNSACRKLAGLKPRAGKSAWTDYMSSTHNYSSGHFAAKENFVRAAMNEFRPRQVLDVGCNTGHFSEMAAHAGADVVAIDYDPVVLDQVWNRSRLDGLNILPLNVNLCRPTPAVGWRNEEWPSFLDRARSAFDCVLMLAVIHHMLVTERVPLPEIIDMAAELTRGIAILEFVGPEDSMFRRIARGRDHLHTGLDAQAFEHSCSRRFDIIRRQHLPETQRWLYLLRRRP